MSRRNRDLTSFASRMANLVVANGEKPAGAGEEFENVNRIEGEKSTVEKILRNLFQQEEGIVREFVLAVIFGLLIFKRGGIRFPKNSNWKHLAGEGAMSDYWIDYQLFCRFHMTAGMPLNTLLSQQKLTIEQTCFNAMHDGGVDWRIFQQVMMDFRALLPVLSERLKCGEGLSVQIGQGEWLAAIFPLIWEVEMAVNGAALSGESNGRHRQISAGLPRGRNVEVGSMSFFSNGKMPTGALFAGNDYVTIVTTSPDNEDMRLSCEADGMAHFQNRLLRLISQPMQMTSNANVGSMPSLPEIPEVPELETEVAGISKCVQAHEEALRLRKLGLDLLQKLEGASDAQANLSKAQSAQRQAAQLVERLEQELAQARQQLEKVDSELLDAQAAVDEIGDSQELINRLALISTEIQTKLGGISEVVASLARI